MIARLEVSTDLSKVSETISNLGFDVIVQDKKVVFVYKKSTTIDALRTAIKSAKEANKFTNQIKVIYGTSSTSI